MLFVGLAPLTHFHAMNFADPTGTWIFDAYLGLLDRGRRGLRRRTDRAVDHSHGIAGNPVARRVEEARMTDDQPEPWVEISSILIPNAPDG